MAWTKARSVARIAKSCVVWRVAEPVRAVVAVVAVQPVPADPGRSGLAGRMGKVTDVAPDPLLTDDVPTRAHQEWSELAEEANTAQFAYHVKDAPTISDGKRLEVKADAHRPAQRRERSQREIFASGEDLTHSAGRYVESRGAFLPPDS